MNREVFCSCSMGSAVPLSYDLPTLPTFHSTFSEFLFSFSISPLFILQQLSILLPCDSLLLALPRFFFCFFSHLWRPPTHLFKKALSHPCFVKLCDAHLYLQWLSSDFPYSPTSQPPLARLFTNAQVAEKFKQTFLKWRSWPEISVQVLVASKGGLSGMWWENMSFSINKCYCMDANHIKIHTPTRPNSLIQTIFFGRVTLALRTSLLNHRDHQSSSDIGKRFNITTTQRKSELYRTWIRLRFPRNTFCPVCHRLSVYEEESVARSMYGEILSP